MMEKNDGCPRRRVALCANNNHPHLHRFGVDSVRERLRVPS